MKNLCSFYKIFNIILTYLVLINCVNCEIRLCADEKCETVISHGISTANYNPSVNGVIHLKINTKLKVFSKPNTTTTKPSLNEFWEVEIQGRRGLAPNRFIKETNVLVKTANLVKVNINQHASNVHEPEIQSSQVLTNEEYSTTTPLKVEEVPKNIVQENMEEQRGVTENIRSTTVDNQHTIDGTTITPGIESEDDDDGLVDSDDDYEEDYSNEEEENLDRSKYLAAEIENMSKDTNENASAEQNNILQVQQHNAEELKIESSKNNIASEKKTENVNSENLKKTDETIENVNGNNKKTNEIEKSLENLKNEEMNESSLPPLSEVLRSSEHVDTARDYKMGIDEVDKENLSNFVENQVAGNIPQQEVPQSQEKDLTQENNLSEQKFQSTEENIVTTSYKTDNNGQTLNSAEQIKNENEISLKERTQFDHTQNIKSDNIEAEFIPVLNDVQQPEVAFVNPLNEQVPQENNDNSVEKVKYKTGEKDSVTLLETKADNPQENKELPLEDIQSSKDDTTINNQKSDDPGSNEKLNNLSETENATINQELTENEATSETSNLNTKLYENHNEVSLTTQLENHQQKNYNQDRSTNFDQERQDNQNNVEIIRENAGVQDINSKEQENQEIFNNVIQDYNSVSTQVEDENLKVTTPGYEENNFGDSPIETITKNPAKPGLENLILPHQDHLILNQYQRGNEMHENQIFQHTHDNKFDPASPQPLTQNIAEDSNVIEKVESSSNSDYFAIGIETFNIWSGKLIDTINGFWKDPVQENEIQTVEQQQSQLNSDIKTEITKKENLNHIDNFDVEYCKKLGPNDNCPNVGRDKIYRSHLNTESSFTESDFFTSMSDKILEMFDMLVLLCIAAISSIIFAFGYYCICNSRKENLLISKLNVVERNLLAANKEVTILKQDLQDSRCKLSSIEDSTFGTNDMVNSLKKKLEDKQKEVAALKKQILTLEKELENTAAAGVELNKIISELVTKQNEQQLLEENIEESQKQISEQNDTIAEINGKLAEKTHENTELHLLISEQSIKFQSEIEELQNQITDLENEKLLLQSRFEEKEKDIREELVAEVTAKAQEIEKLHTDILSIKKKYDEINRKSQTSESKIESLKECIRNMNKESWADIDDLIETVDIKADNLLLEKENSTLKEQLEGEKDAKKLLEDRIKSISGEVANLKVEHDKAEKDKLEAQTRLDVLSNYFKEKEAQLQKDLTIKEALWLKQQGETTSTVEKIRTMQDEIQALKSQNDSLRAEIEAQAVAHKTQLATLENRAHETWLLSRQSERKYEEARSESSMLRRKLTALVSSNNQSVGSNNTSSSNDINRLQNSIVDGVGSSNLNSVPSPIHLDSPSSPALVTSNLPPPPPFLPPPPFMPPLPGPFMGMPAPFALPQGGRPPPLGGRLMSPPPPPQHRRSRYSPSLIDDDDDDDYDYDDYDDDRSQKRGRNNRDYSPENGRYSPDSRYNYTTDVMSQYDTETDFSPQVSPREESFLRGRRGGSINRDVRHNDRSTPLERTNSSNSKSFNKALSPSPQKNQTSSGDNRSNKSNKVMKHINFME